MGFIPVLLFCVIFYGQNAPIGANTVSMYTHSERIGNFSLELLHYTGQEVAGRNLILAPITTWTVLTVISEGAQGKTYNQLKYALRLPNRTSTRSEFQNLTQSLRLKTDAVELAKLNTIFVNRDRLPEHDFVIFAKSYYETDITVLDFKDTETSAKITNEAISRATHGRIPKIVESSDFSDASLVLTSAVYFRGQWTSAFNATDTSRQPFHDSHGKKIGEVNMMYNRYSYPFTIIKELQARIVELPYGKENEVSMLIMLPNTGVTINDMFLNFKRVPLDSIFKNIAENQELYGDDEIECYIPRFKIETELNLIEPLKKFGIVDLFDTSARLPYLSRFPSYVKTVKHKAEIEVTEEGTTATGVTVGTIVNYSGATTFKADRPFTYLIVNKKANTILFGGIYQEPSLY